MELREFAGKPKTIKAVELTTENAGEIATWVNGTITTDGVQIQTLEGTMLASWGDFVVQGIYGEFYPVKPDIFHESYEEVTR